MHISIDHLGPVVHAEFTLSPLTVFIGDNNQGKTTALTVATAMLGNYGLLAYTKVYKEGKLDPYDEITHISQDIVKDKWSQIDLIDFIQKKYYADLGEVALIDICTILGGKVSTGGKLSFTASSKDIEDVRSRITRSTKNILGIGLQGEKKEGSLKLNFSPTEEFEHLSERMNNLKNDSILDIIQETLSLYIPRTFFFPSERASLSLISGRLTVSSSDEWPISLPLRQYMDVLREPIQDGDSRDDMEIRKELSDIFKNITQDKITLSQLDSFSTLKIQIRTDKSAVDINDASSSLKSLAGFALYLQYRARSGDVIVIDEPEQNLHPNQQAKFIEFLSLLVNRGLQVALTTHSPYIIQHLQSLILAYELTNEDKTNIVDKLYLKQQDSLISRSNVGVYLFRNGTSEDILFEDGQINWQTFCDTVNTVDRISDLVFSKRAKCGEKRNDNNAI